ncbi:kinesin-domain-containing protein [Aspergillus japonicus CBS 114.51]|uniref:Kinesin-domain-containing protein n=2 Tax=Aspergillus TaxID=5052 RepID=A0A2V5HJ17_ASPV1|nr:kinesin-domain-containing protein [Aspergillus japonicus CBS 114.51]PYI21383.1 kinesin-domain-containing protein [Aspergillus violaceofuscus CBS 115571]RAH84465.1 kinesin-domain-containing protein [Aspergillus japonicus CBS 114.51]
MSVRVVARIRPLLKSERDLDVILRTGPSAHGADKKSTTQEKGALATLRDRDTVVRIPNPKNESEEYSFQFNAVYEAEATQQELYEAEVAPTVKHLFNGFDVTLFAYGVTGTGKTHTMRGGKSLVDRGVIPRLLSSIYRRSRKMEKESNGETTVNVSLSYYEIYNDKVFDLFEPPEKRTLAGLPLRDNGGKTVVVGLTERPCHNLKEFEILYDQANINRSTSATKLNAHSSRSHAILCVRVTVSTGDKTCVSTASAIDLAGSEDNRRTDNDKERMVESASINKSLFVLAQCVEAISKKHSRIPYRESKMTRILSLGQNNGLTVMILNLAPVKSYHLDTISSLNFANRTKKIEVREVENEPIFKGPPRPVARPSIMGTLRQPLRPLTASVNVNLTTTAAKDAADPGEKPLKAFHVYSDKSQPRYSTQFKKPDLPKRTSLSADTTVRITKQPTRLAQPTHQQPSKQFEDFSAARIEEMVERKVEEILAVRAVSEQSRQTQVRELNEQVQRRLELLEQRIEGSEDARAEGLSYLLMAKQHQGRGEDNFALKMYQLALPFFPQNEKLARKIANLKERIHGKSHTDTPAVDTTSSTVNSHPSKRDFGSMLSLKKQPVAKTTLKRTNADDSDADYEPADDENTQQVVNQDEEIEEIEVDLEEIAHARRRKRTRTKTPIDMAEEFEPPSPRTIHLLSIINSRDVSQIKLLKGVGVKKAEAIVDCLCEMDQHVESPELEQEQAAAAAAQVHIHSLAELSKLKGVGLKSVQSMRNGVLV